ncbi:MAG: alanine--tRNA ligase-related protein [Candidatus Poseidoniales archaeon]
MRTWKKRKFTAKVIYCEKSKVAFDMTLFYPEGGGQLGDVGSIEWNGDKE